MINNIIANREIVRVDGQAIQAGNTSTWQEIAATFVAQQDVRESSRALYARTISRYFAYLNSRGLQLDGLNREDILDYKDYLISSGLASLTVGSYLVVVRKFYEWSEAARLYPNIAKGVKTPRRRNRFLKQHLTADQSTTLLSEPATLRDKAIISTMLRCGLRCIEITRLTVADIATIGGRRVLKVWGKGRDDNKDFVILTDKAYQPIKEYLQSEPKKALNAPLFSGIGNRNRGGQLTTHTVSCLAKKYLRAEGLDGHEYTAHSLRHTTACALLNSGASVTDVQQVLRHSSPATTEIYLASIKEDNRIKTNTEALLDNVF